MKKSEVKKEISDFSYWKQLNYHDGLLYCSLLSIDGKDDWRMMNLYETDWLMTRGVLYNVQRKNYKKIKLMINEAKWYQPSFRWLLPDLSRIKWVIPVRGYMNIQISDSQHWKKLNIGDMKFIVDFIVIDDYTDWRLPRYEEIVKMVPIVNNDGTEIYVNGIWTIQMFETFSEIPSYSTIQYWMVPVRDVK